MLRVPRPRFVRAGSWGAMPQGLKRYYGQGHLHFVTFSCYRRLPLLGTVRARNLFVRELARVRREYGFALVGYVVMPEHAHMLISEPKKGTPSTVLQMLKQRVSRKMRKRRRVTAAANAICPLRKRHHVCRSFGKRGFMISMYSAARRGERSWTTCTAIR